MSDTTYKILRTVGGITYFALVSVRVETCTEGTETIADLSEPDEEAGEVSSTTEPTWVKAAIAGAMSAVDHLRKAGRIHDEYQIRITRIVGSVLDTRDDVVECAATIATLLAFDGHCDIEPTFDGTRWRVDLG
jgi:hypothetical protein